VIRAIKVTERGAVPRNMRKAYTAASKLAWVEAGKWFHTNRRDLRFTTAHARKAGYLPRRGEEPGLSRREYFLSYTGRKQRRYGHRRPLEYSGETRRLVRSASMTSTSKSVRVAYAGARKFNFRNPHSQIRMADEFRRLTADEPALIGGAYDRSLNTNLQRDTTTHEQRF
jgi:hypothetical protein